MELRSWELESKYLTSSGCFFVCASFAMDAGPSQSLGSPSIQDFPGSVACICTGEVEQMSPVQDRYVQSSVVCLFRQLPAIGLGPMRLEG